MGDQSNPRKLYVTGNSPVVSLPKDWIGQDGFEPGDRFVLERTENGFTAEQVEFRRASDV